MHVIQNVQRVPGGADERESSCAVPHPPPLLVPQLCCIPRGADEQEKTSYTPPLPSAQHARCAAIPLKADVPALEQRLQAQ